MNPTPRNPRNSRNPQTPNVRALLAPHQMAIFDDESPVVVIRGCRRGGKDNALSAKVTIPRIAGRINRDFTYSTTDADKGREFILECQRWCRIAGHIAEVFDGPEMFTSGKPGQMQTTRIYLPPVRGRTPVIRVISSEPDAPRGYDGDQGLSEFAFRPKPWEAYDSASPCTALGGQVFILSSPGVEGDPFEEVCAMGARRAAGKPLPNDLPVSLHRFTIEDVAHNGYLDVINRARGTTLTPDKFIADCRAMCRTQEAWDREFMLKASAEINSLFPYDRLRMCPASPVVPTTSVRDFMCSIRERLLDYGGSALFAGCDIGRVEDPFVITARAQVGGMLRLVGILCFAGRSFAEMEFSIESLMSEQFALGEGGKPSGDTLDVRRLCIDSTGLGMDITERSVNAFGYRIEGVNFSAPVKEELAMTARVAVEERTVDMSQDVKVLRAWNGIRCETTSAGNLRYGGDRGPDGHQDEFWADALCLHAAKTGKSTGGWVGGYCA